MNTKKHWQNLKEKIEATDKEIDKMVYGLYMRIEEEIRVVGGIR